MSEPTVPPAAPAQSSGGEGVAVWNPEGALVRIPAFNQQTAMQGYRPASPEEVQSAEAEAKYGGAGQGLAAFGEGLGSALTFGASSGLERAFGVGPADIEGRQQAHPVAHGAGTALGIAIPLALTDGMAAPLEAGAAGAAGAAARTAAKFTAPALIQQAGHAVAGLAEGRLAGTAGALLPLVAGGATEGALYSGADTTEKALLGDPHLTWERAATELGLGALFGGTLAGGFGAATKGLAHVLEKATAGAETVAKMAAKGDSATINLMLDAKHDISALEEVAPGAAEAISQATPQAAEFIVKNVGKVTDLEQQFPGVTEILARADPDTSKLILDNWDKLLKDPQRRIEVGNALTDATNTAYRGVEDALRTVNQHVRPAEIERLASKADQGAANEALVKVHDLVDQLAAKMRAEPDLFQPSVARELELIRDGLRRDSADVGKGLAEKNAPKEPGSTAAKVLTRHMPQGEPVHYEVVEVENLIPSHSPHSFTPHEEYPAGIQERNYLGDINEQRKVVKGGAELNPSLLVTDTPSALDGPPLVTSGAKKYALGGNGRSMMIHRAFEEPEKVAAYKKELLAKSHVFGIPANKIEKMKRPVLVRVVDSVPHDAPAADLVGAVRRYNTGLTQEMSDTTRAIAEAKTMTPGTIASIGKLLGGESEKSLRDIMRDNAESLAQILRRDGIINAQNEGRWLQGGAFTDQAKNDIEGMFLGRVFEHEQRLKATAPELQNKIERIVPALLKVAGQTPEFDAIGGVRRAIDLLNAARLKGLTLEQYVHEATHQGTMFGGPPKFVTGDAYRLAKVIDESKQKQLQSRFGEWAAHLDPQPSLLDLSARVRPTEKSAQEILFRGVKPPVDGLVEQSLAAPPPPTVAQNAVRPRFSSEELAREIFERASAAEPSVTKHMQSLVESGKTELVGLESRINPVPLIQQNLDNVVARAPTASRAAAFDEVRDPLRYTLQINDSAAYVKEAEGALRKLESLGYKVEKLHNFWGKDARPGTYQGVNVALKSPEGLNVEVQFHTPQSFAAKDAARASFEEYRKLPADATPRHLELERIMGDMQAKVAVPPGAATLQAPAPPMVTRGLPAAEVFKLLNRTKQLVDPMAKFGKLITPEWRRTAGAMKDLRSAIKGTLEDENVWGEAGRRQAAFNKAMSRYFTAREAITRGPAFQKLMQKVITDTGAVDYEANPRSVNAWINAMADGRGGKKSDTFAAYLKRANTLADEMEASGYDGADKVRQMIRDVTARAADIRQRATVTQLVGMLSGKEIQNGLAVPMGQRVAMQAVRMVPGAAGHLLGALTGNLTGTIEKVRDPALTVRVLSTLERYSRRASERLRKASDSIFKTGAGGAAGGEAAQKFAEGGLVKPEGYADAAATLRGHRLDLDGFSAQVSRETARLKDHAPTTADAAHAFAARVVAHLGSKLPDAGAARGALDAPFEPSRTELAGLNRHVEIAQRGPLAALEHLMRGTLHPDHLAASMAMFPKLHGEMQSLVAEALAGHLTKGGRVPIALRQPLGQLLGVNLDYVSSPQGILSAQATYQQPGAGTPQGQAGGGAAPQAQRARPVDTRLSERAATGSQTTEMHLSRV